MEPEGINALECGCEVETRSFGTQVRLCSDHKHLAADTRLRPNFSHEHANNPRSTTDRACNCGAAANNNPHTFDCPQSHG